MGNEFSLVLGGGCLSAVPGAYTLKIDESPNPQRPGIFSCAPGTTETIFGFIALEAGTPTDQRLRVDAVVEYPARERAAQGEELSSSDEKTPRGKLSSGKPEPAARAKGEGAATRDQQMGAALRSVYQRAVDEKVPDEMMDLLGKLG